MSDSSSEKSDVENALNPTPAWIEKLNRSFVEYVNELLKPCASTEDLLENLDRLQYCLSVTSQDYKELFEVGLNQSKNALIANVLIRHAEMNVRISAAACISDLFRITAPCEPYEEDQIREFFKIAVGAFESLPCLSGRAYRKSVYILRTISYSNSCMVMLDLEMHDLVHKMFHLFLNGIRTSHSEDIFSAMENIMTLIIRNNEDCEESAVEVAKILLASLKRENQNVSPVAFRLAESIFRNCSKDLEPFLSEAGGSLGLPLENYGEVVVSFYCAKTPSEDMGCDTVIVDLSDHEEAVLPIEGGLSHLGRENETDHLEADENQQTEIFQEVQKEDDPVRGKRVRKPNSLVKYEEGYDPLWMLASCTSIVANSSRVNKKGKKMGRPKKHIISSGPIFQKEDIKRQESFGKMHNGEKSGGNNTVSKDFEGDFIAKIDLENRQEYPTKKDKGKSVISEGHTGDVFIKTLVPTSISVSSKGEASSGELSNLLHESQSTTSKQEASKVGDTVICFADKFVGRRIKVWWPLDLMFYEGEIIFFDHSTKKHNITYDYGAAEMIDLEVECWEFIDEGAED